MAAALDGVGTSLAAAASSVIEANTGAGIDAFADHWDRVGASGGAVPKAAEHCRDMAQALRDFADAIDEVREQILELAAEIAASVAIGVGLAVFTAGISAAAVTATTARLVAAAARLGVTLGLRAATIISRIAVVASMGAVESMAANTVIQVGGNLAFNQNHNPLEGFDLGEVGVSGGTGFLAALPVAGVSTARALRAGGFRLQGEIGENVSGASARLRGETILGDEITVRTASTKVRTDWLVEEPNGTLKFIDAKTGPKAGFTTNQRIGYPELESQGGVPTGANAERAHLPPGEPIPPTRVQIDRWKW